MTIDKLVGCYPALSNYVRHMPEDIKTRFTLRTFPPHSIIHQKEDDIHTFGIVYSGQHRVINEFENGNIFMIEKNTAISFIGEVTLLAGKTSSSVTIESLTECQVLFISSEDFFRWIGQDIEFLRTLTQSVSHKLYSTSCSSGERQYHSARFLVTKYLVNYAGEHMLPGKSKMLVMRTREQIGEELGMTVKTLNRAIATLKEDEAIQLHKGKIQLTQQQLSLMRETIRAGSSCPKK